MEQSSMDNPETLSEARHKNDDKLEKAQHRKLK
jgi:hypothetical protein